LNDAIFDCTMQRLAAAKAESAAAVQNAADATLRLMAAKAEEAAAMDEAVATRVELVAAMEVVTSWNATDAPIKELADAKAELVAAIQAAADAKAALDAREAPHVAN